MVHGKLRYNNNKVPFQIKFKSKVICCGDGFALPTIKHRLTRKGDSERNIQRFEQKLDCAFTAQKRNTIKFILLFIIIFLSKNTSVNSIFW